MRALVTGGAGFIGSQLVRALLRDGWEVRVVDDLSSGSFNNLTDVHKDVDFVVGDVSHASFLRLLMGDVDVVYHLAGLPSLLRSVATPTRSYSVNMGGTLAVLSAAWSTDVAKVVFASSSSVYGHAPGTVLSEDMVVRAHSPGAAIKVAGEAFCSAFAGSYGTPTVMLRLFNVYGPGEDYEREHAGVIARFVARMLQGRRPVIFGDGFQTRDFTFIDDAVQALVLAGRARIDVPGEIVNIGSGVATSLLELAGLLNDILRSDLRPVHARSRRGDFAQGPADLRKAADLLGYRPWVPLREGLVRCIDWHRSHRGPGLHLVAG